jgi:hypothetical protein
VNISRKVSPPLLVYPGINGEEERKEERKEEADRPEVLALISLKKFRHLRRSYHANEGPR